MSVLACLPLIAADVPAVLALDQRCLGGLWTASGYQKELASDCSDLCVLVSALTAEPLQQRMQISHQPPELLTRDSLAPSPLVSDSLASDSLAPNRSVPNQLSTSDFSTLAAGDPTKQRSTPVTLLGMGCLWAILEEAHITTLAIEPSYQGQKLGLLLLTHLLECSRRRGLTRATLEVRASNQTAQALYHKFGFREAGQRKRYYSNGENAQILWRSGLQSDDFGAQIAQYRQHAIAHIAGQSGHTVLVTSSY